MTCRAEEAHDDREPPDQKKPKKVPPMPAPEPADKQPVPVEHAQTEPPRH